MNNASVKFIVLGCCLILASACSSVTFKKRYGDNTNSNAEQKIISNKASYKKKKKIKINPYAAFTAKDKILIRLFFKDKNNSQYLHNAIIRSPLSKKQNKKLVASAYIDNEISVLPLPLVLEQRLIQLPVSLMRVQAGKNIMLMNAKSRKIIDIIKIKK